MGVKMIQYKPGVNKVGLSVLLVEALHSIEPIFRDYELPLVVTSANDGKHSPGSLHPHGLAVDIRSRHILAGHLPTVIQRIKGTLRSIDKRYQVIDEGDHIHIEYDRRSK